MDDGPEDSFAGGGAASGRINKRRGAAGAASGADLADLEDELDDDEDGGGGLGFARAKRQKMGAATGAGAAQGAGLLRPGAAATALMAAPAPRLPRAQAAVQPGATPEGAGGGRFLAYTSVGCVISRKVDSHRTCEVGGQAGVSVRVFLLRTHSADAHCRAESMLRCMLRVVRATSALRGVVGGRIVSCGIVGCRGCREAC